MLRPCLPQINTKSGFLCSLSAQQRSPFSSQRFIFAKAFGGVARPLT